MKSLFVCMTVCSFFCPTRKKCSKIEFIKNFKIAYYLCIFSVCYGNLKKGSQNTYTLFSRIWKLLYYTPRVLICYHNNEVITKCGVSYFRVVEHVRNRLSGNVGDYNGFTKLQNMYIHFPNMHNTEHVGCSCHLTRFPKGLYECIYVICIMHYCISREELNKNSV